MTPRRAPAKVLVGTSGWNYPHWRSIFYPPNLPERDWLTFYAQEFPVVEVNYSFYRLPKPSTYKRWGEQTPADFHFALKASRFITHIKRLKGVKKALSLFLENAESLGKKRGPILFQFPPSFRADLDRLEKFLELLPKDGQYAFEFRHSSWFGKDIYALLQNSNVALVAADTPRFPYVEVQTADFFYLRLHGHEVLYASKYRATQLKEYAKKIRSWQKRGDVFVFFDNDARGFAVDNALELKKLVSSSRL